VSFIDPFSHIITYLGALIHEIAFLDNAQAIEYLSKFDTGVKAGEEFYTDKEADTREYRKPDASFLSSL
jgi:hypothetical protein